MVFVVLRHFIRLLYIMVLIDGRKSMQRRHWSVVSGIKNGDPVHHRAMVRVETSREAGRIPSNQSAMLHTNLPLAHVTRLPQPRLLFRRENRRAAIMVLPFL